MAKPSYGDKKREEADVSYEIATPFHPSGNNAEILLIDKGDAIEIIVYHIAEPRQYYINYPDTESKELNPDPTEKQIRENEVAQWIIEETIDILSKYNPEKSDYETNSGNQHLSDVYFTCDRDEVNEAVLLAKEFIHTIERKMYKHQQQYRETVGNSPESDLE